MRFNTRTIGVLALVAMLITGAGAATAALTYDQETTNSQSTSDWADGDAVDELDNSSQYATIQVISDNSTTSGLANPEEAFTLELTVNDSNSDDDGRTFYTNTSTAEVVNASAGHYAFNISHAEMFAELERDINENVTVDVTTTFNASEDDEESATIQIKAVNGDEHAVEVISKSDVNDSDDVEVKNRTPYWGLGDEFSYASYEGEKSIKENTTVTYVFEAKDFDTKATDAYDAGSFSSGDYVWSISTKANDRAIMVFDSEKGETNDPGWFSGGFTDEDTYGVFYLNGNNGDSPALEIVPRGEADDSSTVDVTINANKKLGFWKTLGAFGYDAANAAGSGKNPA